MPVFFPIRINSTPKAAEVPLLRALVHSTLLPPLYALHVESAPPSTLSSHRMELVVCGSVTGAVEARLVSEVVTGVPGAAASTVVSPTVVAATASMVVGLFSCTDPAIGISLPVLAVDCADESFIAFASCSTVLSMPVLPPVGCTTMPDPVSVGEALPFVVLPGNSLLDPSTIASIPAGSGTLTVISCDKSRSFRSSVPRSIADALVGAIVSSASVSEFVGIVFACVASCIVGSVPASATGIARGAGAAFSPTGCATCAL